jgi:hypothetical protein
MSGVLVQLLLLALLCWGIHAQGGTLIVNEVTQACGESIADTYPLLVQALNASQYYTTYFSSLATFAVIKINFPPSVSSGGTVYDWVQFSLYTGSPFEGCFIQDPVVRLPLSFFEFSNGCHPRACSGHKRLVACQTQCHGLTEEPLFMLP